MLNNLLAQSAELLTWEQVGVSAAVLVGVLVAGWAIRKAGAALISALRGKAK